MPSKLNLTGKRYGKLTVIEPAPNKKEKTYWKCKCDCGNECIVQTTHLRNHKTTSCGCKANRHTKHVKSFRKRIKIALVNAFNNECYICKIKRPPEFYEFHHIDPESKKFGFSAGNTHSKQKTIEEAKKCVMLCPNCHREIELKFITPELKSNFDEQIFIETMDKLL
jgi:hypothetical protein